jgi:acetyl/propionyl-CoA carboxylase alpha subunit
MIRKLLISNRGEIAARIARTARDMGIDTVALYSDADRGAVHVTACDEAIRLPGERSADTYLRADLVLDAALRTGADAVHPGYGFLSENAMFAEKVAAAGLTWVGPPAPVIAVMGDKLAAKKRMSAAGVPGLPSREVAGGVDVVAAGAEVGYPLLVKAAAGGGGKGMRLVQDPTDLVEAVESCRRESGAAFGDDRVFLEKFMTGPRHVEVQIFGDVQGNVVHLYERECSLQRRHQKIVEESPSPGITPELRSQLCEAAVAAGRAIGYQNAGTVEFVVGSDGTFSFLEVNTRLQVEHPVTEAITGLDLVRWQLLVAAGAPLPLAQDQITSTGHAIEVRLYAEDPANDYLPAPGTIHAFEPGCADSVRWDAGIRSGSAVSANYDPLLAKVIAHASTRHEAAAALARAIKLTHLHGPRNNRDLLQAILGEADFLAGATTTDYLERVYPDNAARSFAPDSAARVAGLAAAVLDGAREWAQYHVLPSDWRNSRAADTVVRFAPDTEVGYRPQRDGSWTVTVDGDAHDVRVGDGVIEVDGHEVPVRLSRVGHDEGCSWEVTTGRGHITVAELPRLPKVAKEEVAGATRAPMPGAVGRIVVAVGDSVAAGDLLCVIEAMKMEQRVLSPEDGTVGEICVAVGQQVDADDVLMIIEGASSGSAPD